MTYEEAAQALGFDPSEPFESHLPLLREAEQRLGRLAEASEGEKKTAYELQLTELRTALEVVEAGPGEGGKPDLPKRRSGKGRLVVSLVVLAVLLGAGAWGSHWITQNKRQLTEEQIARLIAQGNDAVENRRWPEAEEKFQAVLALSPGHEGGAAGMERIAEGKVAERRQQVAYLTGAAVAGVEAREWDQAEDALEELARLEPDHEILAPTRDQIREGRVYDRIVGLIERAEQAIQEERWMDLANVANGLSSLAPNHVDLPRYRELADEGIKLIAEQKQRARELYQEAMTLDEGVYSAEAVEKVREAIRLDRQPEYSALYDKLSRYQRVLKVPEEFATISQALASARDKDSIRVGAGTYNETLVIDHAVNLEGAGAEETVIEFPAANGSVATVAARVRGARVSGVTFSQTGIVLTEERFPVVAVGGGHIALEDCRVEKGSGHGIAVLGGGEVQLQRVEVVECGWDGLAVYEAGSRARVRECRFEKNLHHGIDAWQGGAVEVFKSTSSGNGLAGIVVMSPEQSNRVEGCILKANREVGIMVSNGASAKLQSNQVSSNLLGGIVIRDTGSEASVEDNTITGNEKAGVVVDRNSVLVGFTNNEVAGNKGKQTDLKAVMEDREER